MIAFADSRVAKRVLIVDDDDRQAKLLADLLHGKGWETSVANSAGEAVNLVRTSPKEWDALVLDIFMPAVNGWELLRDLASVRADLSEKVVFVTAARESTVQQMRSQTKAPVLTKPIVPSELIGELSRITGLPTSGAGIKSAAGLGAKPRLRRNRE